MTNPLFDRVQPAELADRSQVIEYRGVIGDFERLRAISEQELEVLEPEHRPRNWVSGPVEIDIAFGWLDQDGALPAATGHIRALMPTVCQRCLEAFGLQIDTPVRIVFGVDEAGHSQRDYDAWEADEDSVRLLDIVEEAVVMALPLAPSHGTDQDCGELAGKIPEREAEGVRPFADLRAQMDEMNK